MKKCRYCGHEIVFKEKRLGNGQLAWIPFNSDGRAHRKMCDKNLNRRVKAKDAVTNAPFSEQFLREPLYGVNRVEEQREAVYRTLGRNKQN